MSFSPQKFREMVFQLLFSLDVGGSAEADLIPFLMKELSVSKKKVREAYQKASAVFEERASFDEKIAEISQDFEIERIGRVERNILRLALYEHLREKEEDFKLIISEALRLGKKFSTKEAVRFLNALLDTICKNDTDTALSTSASPSAE